jgi:hypothetical protein
VLEADSHAKVQMRRKVRGLRAIERAVLAEKPSAAEPAVPPTLPPGAAAAASPPASAAAAAAPEDAGAVVLDYCAAVRGILKNDHGGPLTPPGLRMAEALTEVRGSLQRNLDAKKGGARRTI